MEIHPLRQGWEIFALMETKQEFQVPFYKATIRLHLSLNFSIPCTSSHYTAILHGPQPCCALAFQPPVSRIQPVHSTSSESPPAPCLGFCHCTRILPHPTTSSPIPLPPNSPTLSRSPQYSSFPKGCPQHLSNIARVLHRTQEWFGRSSSQIK